MDIFGRDGGAVIICLQHLPFLRKLLEDMFQKNKGFHKEKGIKESNTGEHYQIGKRN